MTRWGIETGRWRDWVQLYLHAKWVVVRPSVKAIKAVTLNHDIAGKQAM